MAKGETKTTNRMLDDERARTNHNFEEFRRDQTHRAGEAYGRSNQAYDAIFQGYNNLANGQMLPGGAAPGSFGGGSAVPAYTGLSGTYGTVKGAYGDFMNSGGVDANAMRIGHGTLNELQGTGGYDAATRARLAGDIAQYRDFANTGGVDEAARGRIRGAGVFDEFARTGGVSDKEAGNIRARAASGVPAFYNAMTEDMSRRTRAGGGSTTMGNAAALKAARERSRGVAEATLEAELGLSDRVREGRKWGAGNVATAEGGLQSLITGNRLQGIGGAIGAETSIANAVAGNRLQAATNIGASEQNIQGLIQRGKMYGTTGMEGIAGIETDDARYAASLAASGANASADSAAADAKYREQLRLQGLGGLLDLRGQTPGEVGLYTNALLSGIGGRGALANDQINMRYGAQGNNTNGWQTGLGILGGVAGAAGGLMTGAASVFRPQNGGYTRRYY